MQAVAAGSSQTQAAVTAVAAMAAVASGQAEQYSGLSPHVQSVARVEGAWHTSFEPVVLKSIRTGIIYLSVSLPPAINSRAQDVRSN